MNEKITATPNRGLTKNEIDALQSQIMRLDNNRTIARKKLEKIDREIALLLAQKGHLEQDIEYANNRIGELKTNIKGARKA